MDSVKVEKVKTVKQPVSVIEAGRKIYNFRCYFCHGYSGDAKTLASSFLTPPPVDFTNTGLDELSHEHMIEAVTNGEPGTAMMSFKSVLDKNDIAAVVAFVREEFMTNKNVNTKYHTVENGWPDHERYVAAFPFALSEIALDTPWEELSEKQRAGKRMFMSSCVTCHDRARVKSEGVIWESRPLSYPRNNYSHITASDKPPTADALTGATPYAVHDVVPVIAGLSGEEQLGETLYQANCAFCHAADGTGKNWIGSFLESHPRNLTATQMKDMTEEKLVSVIRDGLPETTMSAWKNVLSEPQIKAIAKYVIKAFLNDDNKLH